MKINHAFAVGLLLLALPAHADVFRTNFPVVPLHATGAGHTAGSFAASAMMGASGYSGFAAFPGWEAQVRTQCAAASGTTPWPSGCTPAGMVSVLTTLTTHQWFQVTLSATRQQAALTRIVEALWLYGAPAIVPLYGQADHWVAVHEVTATVSGVTWIVQQVKLYDGGPTNGFDGGFNAYQSGLVSYSAAPWKLVYSRMLGSISPVCDPCTADPWYDKYVVVFDPPGDLEPTQMITQFASAPGVAAVMSEQKARSLVWQALAANGIDKDPELWSAVRGGIAGKAYEVNGVAPDGARWDYYLVPILGRDNAVKALVTLAADDGAYESMQVPAHPQQFTALAPAAAEAIARGQLARGEALTAGILTWDPRSNTPFAKAPTFPYYEYGVLIGVKQVGVVRVSFNKGAVARVER